MAQKVCGTLKVPYQGKEIDLGHWERLTMAEAVKKYSGVDFAAVSSDEEAIALAKEILSGSTTYRAGRCYISALVLAGKDKQKCRMFFSVVL